MVCRPRPTPRLISGTKAEILRRVPKSLGPAYLNERSISSYFFCCIRLETGVSANAIPHTNKLRTRVTHIWGYRRRQPSRGAMEGPLPGETACMITVFSVPGKYARQRRRTNLKASMNTISGHRRGEPKYPPGHRARHIALEVE